MNKPRVTLLILIVAAIVLSLVKIFIANNVATSGIILSSVEEEVNAYKLENMELSAKLYQFSSLTYLSTKAKELGYTENSSQFVLSNQQPVAFKQ